MNSKIKIHKIKHHAPYQPNAPCGSKALKRCGQVKDRIKLKHQVVAVAQDMPTSRTCTSHLSAIAVK